MNKISPRKNYAGSPFNLMKKLREAFVSPGRRCVSMVSVKAVKIFADVSGSMIALIE